jgi:putative transcriptional regulator
VTVGAPAANDTQDERLMVRYHPTDEHLMAYAGGALDEARSVLVATHLALCPACRAAVGRFEAVGGDMLDQAPSVELEGDALARMMARLDEPVPVDPALGRAGATRTPVDTILPEPLRSRVGQALDRLPWRRRIGTLSEVELPVSHDATIKLLRIGSGGAMPRHTHTDEELTLVLAGGFTDDGGHYLRGDVAIADPTITHRPVADAGEDCICLAVVVGEVRLPGFLGRLLAPFVRF